MANIRDADRGEMFFMGAGESTDRIDIEEIEHDLEERLANKGNFVGEGGVKLIGDVEALRAGDTIECKKYGDCIWRCVRY